jgi:hypothetical protein
MPTIVAPSCGGSGLEHFRNPRKLFEDHTRWIFLRKIHRNAMASVYTNSENAPVLCWFRVLAADEGVDRLMQGTGVREQGTAARVGYV